MSWLFADPKLFNVEFRPLDAASSRPVAPGTPGYAGDDKGEKK